MKTNKIGGNLPGVNLFFAPPVAGTGSSNPLIPKEIKKIDGWKKL